MKNSLKMGISIGGPTIIMIFVVLCLTTLGTLSLATANADLKLTQKTAASSIAYYTADNQGALFLSQMDAALRRENSAESIAAIPETTVFTNQDGLLFITHRISISDRQTLVIEVSQTLSEQKTSEESPALSHYKIDAWKVINNDYWLYEDYETPFQDAIPQN